QSRGENMKSHRRNVLVVFILLFQGTFSLSQSLFWQTAGLDSFQVRNFAINAQGDIFAGASNASYGSGLYRSTNNGLTWDTLNIGFPDPRVFSVMVDPRGGIFAGVDSPSVRVDGVYYSSDDGGTWEKRS